jgi:hypothetical protein
VIDYRVVVGIARSLLTHINLIPPSPRQGDESPGYQTTPNELGLLNPRQRVSLRSPVIDHRVVVGIARSLLTHINLIPPSTPAGAMNRRVVVVARPNLTTNPTYIKLRLVN